MGAPLKFPEKGSRVLREWNEQRRVARAIAQRGPGGKRNFAGASLSRLTASLQGYSLAINADLDTALVILRSRARQLCANHEYAKRFLTLVEDNLIGECGPTLQVRAKMSNGQQLDKVANSAIETHWWRWSQMCDIRGLSDLPMLLQSMASSVARDGEILIRLVRGKDLAYGLKLQLLEADRLDESLNTKLANGNTVRMGVEVDKRLKPVAYWLKTAHPGENYGDQYRIERERVPAADIIHVFRPVRAEQVRGYSWFHAVIFRSAMLQGYEEAAIVAARVGAAKNPILTQTGEDARPVAEEMADTKTSTNDFEIGGEPGEFLKVPKGWEMGSWDPDYPHQNFESFMSTSLRGLAMGVDVSAHSLSGNLKDVNFSSARIGDNSERDTWKKLQGWVIFQVCRRLYVEFLTMGLLLGQITLLETGKALPLDRLQKFVDAAGFQGRRWQWTKPSEDIAAAAEEVELGINSRTRIAASLGRDLEDITDELEAEEALRRKKKLGAAPATAGKPKPPAGQDPDEPDPDAVDPEKEKDQ
jgi:lambda family phage portal protein